MKKLLLITSAIILFNCETEELKASSEVCDCSKKVYQSKLVAEDGPNGLHLVRRDILLSTEKVYCQEEQTNINMGSGMYYSIDCK